MYTDYDYKTKKELKAAVADGKQVRVYQPGGLFPSQTDGEIVLEGPHYPRPHTWYAQAIIKDSIIMKVK
jgi:hypothetical protein